MVWNCVNNLIRCLVLSASQLNRNKPRKVCWLGKEIPWKWVLWICGTILDFLRYPPAFATWEPWPLLFSESEGALCTPWRFVGLSAICIPRPRPRAWFGEIPHNFLNSNFPPNPARTPQQQHHHRHHLCQDIPAIPQLVCGSWLLRPRR